MAARSLPVAAPRAARSSFPERIPRAVRRLPEAGVDMSVDSTAPPPQRLTFPPGRRVRRKVDFEAAYKRGRRFSDSLFTMTVRPNDVRRPASRARDRRTHHRQRDRTQSPATHDPRILPSRAASAARCGYHRRHQGRRAQRAGPVAAAEPRGVVEQDRVTMRSVLHALIRGYQLIDQPVARAALPLSSELLELRARGDRAPRCLARQLARAAPPRALSSMASGRFRPGTGGDTPPADEQKGMS